MTSPENMINRFVCSKWSIKAVLLFLITITLIACSNNNDLTKPNIIIINVDDLGWKDVGFMGSKYYETRNIDYLASRGMIFTNGYAAAANCAPSRASMLTGLWNTRHGIYTVGSSERGETADRKLIPITNKTKLAKKFVTLPEILKRHGYYTCHAGKWHLGKNPKTQGFDYNIGGGWNGHPKDYYPPYQNVDLKGDDEQHLTDLIMEKTLSFIDNTSNPFFLYYSPYAVHSPIIPVEHLKEKYESKLSSSGQNNPDYASMIENLDRNIGLLIHKLKANNVFDKSLIIFTSDNGGVFKVTKQRPLRAGKGSYYEGGIRVPFVFILPKNIKEGGKSDLPITHLDILPTVLDIAGIDKSPYPLDGISLLPFFEQNSTIDDRPLFWHFPIYLQATKNTENESRDPLFRTRPGSALRFGHWKLHYYFENNETELYNLSTDTSETTNLSAINTIQHDRMLALLKNWWELTDAAKPEKPNPEYYKPEG